MVLVVVRSRPSLRVPLVAAFLVTNAVAGGAFVYTSQVDKTVDEDVVRGAPAAPAQAPAAAPAPAAPARPAPKPTGPVERFRGRFSSLEHTSSGVASIVELPDGSRKLTLTEFSTSPGPDLRVYLVAGRPKGESTDAGFKDLGALKGNRGDQQYSVPRGVDVGRYSTVMVYCRAFTAGFARAPLRAA